MNLRYTKKCKLIPKLSETGTSYFGPNVLSAKPVEMIGEELKDFIDNFT